MADAAVEGKVLRYAATLSEGKCSVGPTAVAKDSPLGRLTGTDNLVELYSAGTVPTRWVIQGSRGGGGGDGGGRAERYCGTAGIRGWGLGVSGLERARWGRRHCWPDTLVGKSE